MGSEETERQRCPARPGLPQGADEAVDRALRVQGHDVPYVEEAGHFIRHAASCSRVDVLPLCALAALSREPPPQGRNGARDCSAEGGGGHGAAPSRGGAGQQRSRSRRHARRAQPGSLPAGFLFLSELFSPTPLLLLLPRLPLLPPPRALPPLRPAAAGPATGSRLVVAEPLLGPLGGFLDQVVVPIGQRGREEPGAGGQSGNGGRGRSWARTRRCGGGRATREDSAGQPGPARRWNAGRRCRAARARIRGGRA